MRSKKIKKAFAVLVYEHHMVILGSQNKITDFLIIFALASPFKFPVLNRNKFTIKLGGGPRVVVSTAAFHARVRGSVPGLGGLKETKLFLPHPRVKVSIVGSLRDREVACSASDRQGSNFESCVWRTVSSQSSHHPQEVLLAQFSLYVHKGGLKPDSFYFTIKLQCPIVIISIQRPINMITVTLKLSKGVFPSFASY